MSQPPKGLQSAIGTCVHPPAGSQESMVHASPSSQLGHVSQLVAPVIENVPVAHAVHAVAPADVAEVPDAHDAQVADPAAAAKLPGTHAVQTACPATDD